MRFHHAFLGAGLALAFSPLLAQSGSDTKPSASPSPSIANTVSA